jgi:hypothetical protein
VAEGGDGLLGGGREVGVGLEGIEAGDVDS